MVVHEFLDAQGSSASFRGYFEASMRYGNLLGSLGMEEQRVLEFIVPRLPFDLVTRPRGRTPAEDFLIRWGTALPRESVVAVKALVKAGTSSSRWWKRKALPL